MGGDIGEGEMNFVVHPHPHPPPSRGRGVLHFHQLDFCFSVNIKANGAAIKAMIALNEKAHCVPMKLTYPRFLTFFERSRKDFSFTGFSSMTICNLKFEIYNQS